MKSAVSQSKSERVSQASFRDPAGSVVSLDGRILRFIRAAGAGDFQALWASPAVRKLLDSGHLVGTRLLPDAEKEELLEDPALLDLAAALQPEAVLEHQRVSFQSFPYEWAPAMLHAAALLTLDIAEPLLEEDLGLKDAAPYNVLFQGPNPVFVDLLSVERRTPDDPIWIPYAQFLRTFVLPLMANKYFGLSLDQILTTRRDGLEPEEVYRWLKPTQKFRPPFLPLVSIPTWLTARKSGDEVSIYRQKRTGNPEKARFILQSQLRSLRSTVKRLAPPAVESAWSGYMTTSTHYSTESFGQKEAFVLDALAEFAPKAVLDVGCNTGHFSALAARSGARVVALDYDSAVVGRVWQKARQEQLDILPLVVNLTRPTPALGWRNAECASFLDRARGSFDAVLMLAVIHHMLVTERAPLQEILDLAAELTTNILIIEYIAPEDPMFRHILRGREELHKDLNEAAFESAAGRHFEIVRRQHHDGTTRSLYILKRR